MNNQPASLNLSAACKSTETSWLTPFSCMVTLAFLADYNAVRYNPA
jgi:hypothetical protein